MYDVISIDEMDVVIAAAAVADYKPKIVATQNKRPTILVIELEKTKDILASLGKKENQF
jgi:phosphopantothenoylcysteine decarboxylase/phosphopantothenate--cysteine ligase